MATDKESSFRRLVAIASPHHKNPDRWLPFDAIRDSLQPMIKPMFLKFVVTNLCFRPEIGFTSKAVFGAAVRPGAHDQPLVMFRFRQRDECHVGRRASPSIVPTANV